MDKWRIYYNPGCGTCRKTLDLLKKKKISPEVIEYLKTPLSKTELTSLCKKLKIKPADLMRAKDPIYEKLGLHKKAPTSAQAIALMVKYPSLMQRPVVSKGNRAVVARPPEVVESLF